MNVAVQAESQLRQMILNMDIGPGERITERWAEGQTGASRSSVRSALIRLEAEGLVVREDRGWSVPPIDLDEVDALFRYREILEVAAVQAGAAGLTAQDRASIEAMLASGTAPARDDPNDVGSSFHLWIAGLARNAFVTRGVADALTRLERVRWLERDGNHPAWDEHAAILYAIRDGDGDLASTLLAGHLHETRERLIETINRDRRSLRARGAKISP